MNEASIIDSVSQRWTPGSAEARRLFHGRGHAFEGLEHVVINWFPPVLQICLFKEVTDEALKRLVDVTLSANPDMHVKGIVVQRRAGRATQSEVYAGEVGDEIVVTEHGLRYLIEPMRNQNVGLFLDMGHVREWLGDRIAGQRMLNLFAYTCAFSVHALAHGAECVVNNDMSKNALAWGDRNHAANDHDLRRVRMVPHNLFKSWWKLKQLGPYDYIIIDPPTNQRGSFVAEKSYGQVLKRIPDLANPGAIVIAALNSPFLGPQFLKDQMSRWCPDATLVHTFDGHPDFPDRFPERGLKVFAFEYQPG